MSTILPFRPTIAMTADDDSFSSFDSVSTTELNVGTTNTDTSVDMPSSSFAFRMGSESLFEWGGHRVHPMFLLVIRLLAVLILLLIRSVYTASFFNRDESILLRRLLQLLTVLQYTFLCS